MMSFFNVVLQGPSALHGREKIGGDANLDAREKIACNISQLLIYNTSKGTHHAVKTAAVRHNKAKAQAHGEPASREDGWQRGRQPEAEEHVDPTGPGSRRTLLAKVLETFEVDTAPLLGRA